MMNILDLPQVVLMDIFEYLSYEDVAKNRLICTRLDEICQQVLNRGFNKAVRQHFISFKRIKALLPRRESERRNHYLARHADVLTSIETRISMLSMTYNKYMDLNLCCFIPGRVLDEIFRILRLIATSNKPLRPHEVLQELRDISSMAIEHFDEKIAVSLKKTFAESSNVSSASSSSSFGLDKRSREDAGVSSGIMASGGSASHCCDSFRVRLNSLLNMGNTGSLLEKLKNQQASSSNTLETTVGAASICNSSGSCPTMKYFKKMEIKYKEGIVKMQRMQQIQTQQSRRLQQTVSTVAELNIQVVELKKRLEDVDAKNREISANMNRQINTSESSVTVPSTTKPNINTTTDSTSPSICTNSSDVSKLRNTVKAVRKRRINDDNDGAAPTVVDCVANTSSQPDLASTKKPKI